MEAHNHLAGVIARCERKIGCKRRLGRLWLSA
jgi:hypothetical protein